jgi:S1-C subfamily serine protease
LLYHSVGVHHWTANLIGLLIGCAIGGAAFLVAVPRTESQTSTPAPPSPAATRASFAPAPPARAATLHVQPPNDLPRIAAPLPRPESLPNVIYPDPPQADGPGTHARGTGIAGTGFFVSSDGSLLTAAHVVSGCRQMRVASELVRPSAAQLIASDAKQDIALLRAANVMPPAVLAVGRPAAPSGRLFVLGYPASGGPLIPTETWAALENDRLQPAPAELIDPRRVIWAVAPVIDHGFSGGPMLDQRNGVVVGIVRGMVDSARLHAERASIPASGVVIGPGSVPLAALLRQEGTDTDALPVTGDDALVAARRATVHVLCLY